MITFDKEELLKIAKLSALQLDDKEIILLVEQLKAIIGFTEQLQEVTLSHEAGQVRNINVFRDDIIEKQDSEALLAQAPQREGNYFVVPKILGE